MMISPNNPAACWRMTSNRTKYEPANLLVPSHQLNGETSAATPPSFAHFIIQSQASNNSQNNHPIQSGGQQQHAAPLAFGYLPYELYNCSIQPSDAGTVQQHQLVTLIAGKNQSAPITTTTTNASNNSRLLTFIDNKVKPNQNNNLYDSQQPDHVYCEIPSTLTRLPRDAQQQQQQQQQFIMNHHHHHQSDVIDSNLFHFGHQTQHQQQQQHLKSPRGHSQTAATLSTARYNASII